MVIIVRSTASASPAELILAEATSHVIAPHVFLNSRATDRTPRNIVFVGDGPPLQLLVKNSFTAGALAMPFLPAVVADPGFALGALQLCRFFQALTPHVAITATLGAVSDIWILIENLLVPKALILGPKGLLAQIRAQDTFEFGLGNRRLFTFNLEALYLV